MRQYVEPGASGTDESRPIFSEMLADAKATPGPSTSSWSTASADSRGIISPTRSPSRGLNKAGINVQSITQPLSDDPAGQMVENILVAFDAYTSTGNRQTYRPRHEGECAARVLERRPHPIRLFCRRRRKARRQDQKEAGGQRGRGGDRAPHLRPLSRRRRAAIWRESHRREAQWRGRHLPWQSVHDLERAPDPPLGNLCRTALVQHDGQQDRRDSTTGGVDRRGGAPHH